MTQDLRGARFYPLSVTNERDLLNLSANYAKTNFRLYRVFAIFSKRLKSLGKNESHRFYLQTPLKR